MSNPLVPSDDHVNNWLDRLGCIEFISDQFAWDTMQPAYFRAACASHDKTYGATEAATWWM